MASVKSVVNYIYASYSHKSKISISRLTRIIYLTDWRSAIIRNRQLTDAKWELKGFDPIIKDVSLENLLIEEAEERRKIISALDNDDKQIIDYVIKTSIGKGWEEFISLVCSTYPILTQPRLSELDLVGLANLYKQTRGEMAWGAKINSDTNTH